MRAVVIESGGLTVAERPDPQPEAGELLVAVESAGLNGADLHQVAGYYPAPPGVPADIPGLELAGRVVSVGRGVERFAVGERVMAVVGGGGQAELALVHERAALPVPPAAGTLEAGAFPEVFTTAHDALFTQCQLGPGEKLLVNGGAGGVGMAGVQLAAAAGAVVVASVRRAELRPFVDGLGAQAVDPSEVADYAPFDVILELVGAPNLGSDLANLAYRGRIVVIGVGSGARAEIDLMQLMARRARLSASTLRSRSLEDKAAAARLVEHHVLPLLAAGRLRVPIEAAYRLDEVEAAYKRFAEGGKFGKIVLDIAGVGSSGMGLSGGGPREAQAG